MTAENTQSEKNIRYTLLWSPSDTSLSVTNRWKEEGGWKRVDGRKLRVVGRGTPTVKPSIQGTHET